MDIKKKDPKKEHKQVWTKALEDLLAEWSDKATCFRWLHSRSEKSYRSKNYLFTIPVIILSTLTGTANFAMDSFVPDDYKKMAMGIVGGVNIFAGILSTLQNFLRYAELMEGHRSSGVSWSKFSRNITVELALDEKRRKPAGDFLKICRAEFDRLIEQSPSIDDKIIKQFDYQFKDNDIIRPEVCNGLKKCRIYKPSQEDKLTNILVNVGDKLKHRKEHLKTTKSRKTLHVKQEQQKDIEKGLNKPNSTKPTKPPKDMVLPSSKSTVYLPFQTKVEEISLTLEPEVEAEPEAEPESEPGAEDDTESIEGFLDGITPGQNP